MLVYFNVARGRKHGTLFIQSEDNCDKLRSRSHDSEDWEHSRVYTLDTDLLQWPEREVTPVPAEAVKAVDIEAGVKA
jgi:hypothetical protein